jgi:hypothetical protein
MLKNMSKTCAATGLLWIRILRDESCIETGQ